MRSISILSFFPLFVAGQDITGAWTGHLRAQGSDLAFEIVISRQGGALTGYSLMTFSLNGKDNVGVKAIKLKNQNKGVFLEDQELVYSDYSTPPKRVKLVANLVLGKDAKSLSLKGNFSTRNLDYRTSDNLNYTGTVELVRASEGEETKLLQILGKLGLAHNLSFVLSSRGSPIADNDLSANRDSAVLLAKKNTGSIIHSRVDSNVNPGENLTIGANPTGLTFPSVNMDSIHNEQVLIASRERKTSVVKSVIFHGDSLVLRLYDNGEVDGDSVSVVMNGKVIISRQGLTTRAIRYVIHITAETGDSLLLTLIAENLGSIPPNTGLLIVDDGEQSQEIRFTGDMQTSSAVLFKRQHIHTN